MSFGRPHLAELESFNHQHKRYVLAKVNNLSYAVLDKDGNDRHFGGPFLYAKEFFRHKWVPYILARNNDYYDFYDFEGNATGLFGAPFLDTEKTTNTVGIPFIRAWKPGNQGSRVYSIDGTAFPDYGAAATLTLLRNFIGEESFQQAVDMGYVLHDAIKREPPRVRTHVWAALAKSLLKASETGDVERVIGSLEKELVNHPDRYLRILFQ